MGMILIERPIIFHYELAIKFYMRRLEMYTQGLWNWLLFNVKK